MSRSLQAGGKGQTYIEITVRSIKEKKILKAIFVFQKSM
jgi:hypothetical protein